MLILPGCESPVGWIGITAGLSGMMFGSFVEPLPFWVRQTVIVYAIVTWMLPGMLGSEEGLSPRRYAIAGLVSLVGAATVVAVATFAKVV